MNLDYIKISSDKVVLFVPGILKTTTSGHHLPHIKMTAPFRNVGSNQLLLSFVQPHKPISTTTLSRWCVNVLKESGVNVNIFGSHSTRSASTSKCKISGLSFKEIAKSAGWSNEKTFAKFYDKPIQEDFSNYLFKWNLLFLIYVYMELFIWETYMVLIILKTILIRLRKILDY